MITYALVILVFGISLSVSYLVTPLMKKVAIRTGILCKPGSRRIHSKPIPYLGGLAIYFAFLITVSVLFYANQELKIEFAQRLKGLLIGSTLIVLLGLWDDIKNIGSITKLIGQVIVAFLLFSYGFRIEVLTNPFFGGEMHIPLFLSLLVSVAWFVGLINAMNLIDGLDGLAAGITVIISGSLLLIALYLHNYVTVFLLAILAGSALGFLRFNFYPAKIFMGDAGSMFLGLILASSALIGFQYKSATATVFLVPITALAIPICDTFMAIIRRLLKKGSIFKADKKHLHHRLLSTGLKQKEIVLFMYLVTLYLGVFAFLFVLIPNEYAVILLVLLALGLFMGVRIIGFIERKAKSSHGLELEGRKK